MTASSGRALVAFGLLACASAQQRGYGYQDEMSQAEMLYQQQQAQQRAQQQRMYQAQQEQARAQQQAALLRQAQQQALYEQQLRAAQAERAGGYATPQNGKPALSSKEQKKAAEKRQKELENQKKAQMKELERRRKLAAQGRPRSASQVRSSGGKGPLGLFSFKGLLIVGALGYLYVAQRELLITLTLKPLLFAVRMVWTLAFKPLVRMLVSSKGGGGGGGELPGGY